jgi:hypothetical protein
VVLALAAWGNRWLSPAGIVIQTVDAVSGMPIEPLLVDRVTGQSIEPGNVALAAGPSASARLRRGLAKPLVLGALADAAGGASA